MGWLASLRSSLFALDQHGQGLLHQLKGQAHLRHICLIILLLVPVQCPELLLLGK